MPPYARPCLACGKIVAPSYRNWLYATLTISRFNRPIRKTCLQPVKRRAPDAFGQRWSAFNAFGFGLLPYVPLRLHVARARSDAGR